MRRALLALGGVIIVIIVIVLIRTLTVTSRQMVVEPVADITVDAEIAATRLAQALTYRTISHQDPTRFDPQPFRAFHRFLADTYTIVHRTLKREVVGGYSLLYTWPGTDPALKPIVLLAHMDVVPVDPGTEADWLQPPFSGAVADGYVWGRGAIDDKASLVAILEAVEALVGEGFRPRRTLYLAFGHDEEIGGAGAAAMVELLKESGVQAHYILDEGRSITEGELPGVVGPVAQIGIAEKGYMTV
ncbi:MAG: M20/M25/M40 family metallo-hydrolase, partial [Candidatus Neomarinimicrobiota bacterium]